jgi:DNA polymerase-3 subunit alpha/error-prone DNA polymerase
MAAVISNHGGYYSTFAYVSEAKRCGVKILQPDVNLSDDRWKGRDMTIRVGLQAIHGLSANLIERIIVNRRCQGRYLSPGDFLRRIRPAEDEARQLIHAGALDSLQQKVNRTELLWKLASFMRVQQIGRQLALFASDLPKPPKLQAPSAMNMFRLEYEALGFLCRTHPVVLLQKAVGPRVKSKDLQRHAGCRIPFLGWLLTGKLVSTKTGEAMEFLTFEDEFGVVETTFFPKIYRKYAHLLASGKPYLLYGLVDVDFDAMTLTVERVERVGKLK